jgi:hypothetical protein
LRPKEFVLWLNDEIVILSLASDKCCCLQVDAASSLLLNSWDGDTFRIHGELTANDVVMTSHSSIRILVGAGVII